MRSGRVGGGLGHSLAAAHPPSPAQAPGAEARPRPTRGCRRPSRRPTRSCAGRSSTWRYTDSSGLPAPNSPSIRMTSKKRARVVLLDLPALLALGRRWSRGRAGRRAARSCSQRRRARRGRAPCAASGGRRSPRRWPPPARSSGRADLREGVRHDLAPGARACPSARRRWPPGIVPEPAAGLRDGGDQRVEIDAGRARPRASQASRHDSSTPPV